MWHQTQTLYLTRTHARYLLIVFFVVVLVVYWLSQNLRKLLGFFKKKEALALVFFCEFCEISKNIFFTEHLWTTASEKCFELLTLSKCFTSLAVFITTFCLYLFCLYLHLFWFSRKIAHAHISARQNKNKQETLRCNNRDDLIHLSYTLKISILSEAYI